MKDREPLKIEYVYLAPETEAQKEEAQRRLDAAYNILFEEVLKRRDEGEPKN